MNSKLEFNKNTNLKEDGVDICFYTLFITAISYVIQPFNLRLSLFNQNVPLALLLILIYIGIHIFFIRRFNKIALYSLFPSVIILIYYNLLNENTQRGYIAALFITFLICTNSIRLTKEQVNKIMFGLLSGIFIISLIALFRYIFGHDTILSEHKTSIQESLEYSQYRYLGITYGRSTRNTDATYFLIGFLISIRFLSSQYFIQTKLLFLSLSIFFSTIILLNGSRGAFLPLILVILISLIIRNKKIQQYRIYDRLLKIFFILIPLTFASYFLSNFISENYLFSIVDLIKTQFISIVNPDYAKSLLDFNYTFSNANRLNIYKSSLSKILDYPFGGGLDVFTIGGIGKVLHSENTYFDGLISMGIFFLPILFLFLRKIIFAIRNFNLNTQYRYYFYGMLTVALQFATNSLLDFSIIWFYLGILSIEFNTFYYSNTYLKKNEQT